MRERKRSRPGRMNAVGLTALLCVIQSTKGFTLRSSRISWELRAAAIAEEQDIEKTSSSLLFPSWLQLSTEKEGLQVELPPWLKYDDFSPEQVQDELGWLEYALLEQGIEVQDIRYVMDLIRSQSDTQITVGVIDFVRLLLNLREEENGSIFLTVPVLAASIVHYAECIAARRRGVPDLMQRVVHAQPARLSAAEPAQQPVDVSSSSFSLSQQRRPLDDDDKSTISTTPKVLDPETLEIVHGAARIKRAEILAQAVLGNERALTQARAGRLRDLLLTVTDDWRSLAIRVIACLYRLEGLQEYASSEYHERPPDVVHTAREAIRVYATLAQRLGMHRLKSKIEERAFQILYKRQYQAVSTLYRENGATMKSISNYLLSHISVILHEDDALMNQLEDLQITARVKEPFSFWKKLLKKQQAKGLLTEGRTPSRTSSSLSVTDIQDGVALRVVLQARKLSPEETDATTRARERILCYYIQQLIRSRWPELEGGRMKDYIQFPKPNGYQSLHHTSSIPFRGMEFPFEVQVRSEEMHKIAEYGLAAHWDYKLGSKVSPSSISPAPSAVALLPPSDEAEQTSLKRASTAEPIGSAGSYLDALASAKEDILKQQVYVFVTGDSSAREMGRLVSVPANSSVRATIAAMESLKDCEPAVWRNGRRAQLDDIVENGDVLMVTL